MPACRDTIVQTLAEFQSATSNPVDGVFWDYFDKRIWISPGVDEQVIGEADLDNDGVGMDDDVDERKAYLAACDTLVLRTREVMGDGFIQVFNGVRSHRDSTFAALGDGMYYEIFPTQFFPDPDMTHAMDPDYAFSLFNSVNWPRTSNGGPYVVIGTIWLSRYIDHNGQQTDVSYGNLYRAVGLLTDVFSTWIPGNHHYAWPDQEFNLGPPLGPTVVDGDDYSREFRYGRVELTMETGMVSQSVPVPGHHRGSDRRGAGRPLSPSVGR